MIDTLKLKIILAEKELHQKDLIDLTGLSPYTISRTVSGHSKPNLTTVGKICRAIGINPAEIIKSEE